ncbi:unnamed protein product [Lactuca saligna]|uniref:Uncharacterized protein n=1 Tax=Lactuca saligna TaxID=75948 RepID=A0AA36DZG8_LACSI|nr:unnamed protein product [Lactuca saligna]
MLEFPLGSIEFSKLPFRTKADKTYGEWTNQFKNKTMIHLQEIKMKIVSSKKANMNFKMNFIALLINSLLLYVASIKVELIKVEKKHPVICHYSKKKMRMRENYKKEELGDFGTGELNEKFIEEQLNEEDYKKIIMMKFKKLQMLTNKGLNLFHENVTLNNLKNSLEDIFDDDDEDSEEEKGSDDDDDDNENIEGGENDEENEDGGGEGGENVIGEESEEENKDNGSEGCDNVIGGVENKSEKNNEEGKNNERGGEKNEEEDKDTELKAVITLHEKENEAEKNNEGGPDVEEEGFGGNVHEEVGQKVLTIREKNVQKTRVEGNNLDGNNAETGEGKNGELTQNVEGGEGRNLEDKKTVEGKNLEVKNTDKDK